MVYALLLFACSNAGESENVAYLPHGFISACLCSTLTALVKMVKGIYAMENLRSLLPVFPLPLLDETLSQPNILWYLDNWPNFQRCEKIANPSCLTGTTGKLHILAV